MAVERSVLPKFRTFKNKWFKVINIFTLFTPPVMPCSSGLYIVERWRRARTRWRIINQMFDVESILEFFVVIKFRCNGSCIIVRNIRFMLQLKILWNTRVGLGISLIFTASLPLLALQSLKNKRGCWAVPSSCSSLKSL